MPKIFGANKQQEAVVKKAVKWADECIAKAQTCYIDDEARFRGIFKKFFGNTTKASIEDIAYTMALMGGELRGDKYNIRIKPADGNENASVDAFEQPYGAARPENRAADDAIWKRNRANAASEMWLRPLFFRMGFADKANQSQLETFMHELSHFAAGTIDYDEPQCYGIAGVNYCKGKGVAVAVRNAENVGFFLQEFYYPI